MVVTTLEILQMQENSGYFLVFAVLSHNKEINT